MMNSGHTPEAGERDRLVFLPLGGAGEIGMNLYLYGYGPDDARQWLMVDLGVKFADQREPGIDVIFPDISYIESERASLLGILLTHAHEDHFGAVIDLAPRLEAPVYATPFTANLLRAKLTERSREGTIQIREIALGSRLDLGPFDVEYITVAHSIPEPCALAIRTPLGNVLHTGDWKIDDNPVIGKPVDVDRMKALGDEGCRALVCDSTNALRGGVSPSESDIEQGLAQVIASAKNRVAVTTFASNVGRLLSVARAAKAADRHLIVVGRAMYRALHAARDAGYIDDFGEILSDDEYGYLPPDKVVCLCTGSQGEARAALARIADGTHPTIELNKGDMVIFSSKTIPGNEKSVAFVQNSLAEQGVEIVTADDHLVHVTGHPRRGELEQMYSWLRPEAVIPMHGEPRHLLEHARFAEAQGVGETVVARNGDIVNIAPGALEIIDEAPTGQLHLDGALIVPSVGGPARERRKVSFTGFVTVSIVIDRAGALLSDPVLETFGVPEMDDYGGSVADQLFDAAEGVMRSLPKSARRDDQLIEEAVYRAIRKEAENVWGKKPICKVLLTRV